LVRCEKKRYGVTRGWVAPGWAALLCFAALVSSAGAWADEAPMRPLDARLFDAVKSSDAALVAKLLEKGADPLAKMGVFDSPFAEAAERADSEVLALFFAFRLPPGPLGLEVVHRLERRKAYGLLEKLLAARQPEAIRVEVLEVLVGQGQWAMARPALLADRPLAARARGPLLRTLGYARLGGRVSDADHAEAVKGLLDGATPADEGLTAAVAGVQPEVAKLLLVSASATERPAKAQSFFCVAVEAGEVAGLEPLVKAGADPRRPCGDGTALAAAIRRNKRPVAEWLLAHGADVRQADGEGRTPLWKAISDCELDPAFLLAKGADPAQVWKRKYDPPVNALTFAVESGCRPAFDALVAAGVDVNLVPGEGPSALCMAVLKDRIELARLLLAKKANPACAVDQVSALGLAVAVPGRWPLAQLLLDAGASADGALVRLLKLLDDHRSYHPENLPRGLEVARAVLAKVRPEAMPQQGEALALALKLSPSLAAELAARGAPVTTARRGEAVLAALRVRNSEALERLVSDGSPTSPEGFNFRSKEGGELLLKLVDADDAGALELAWRHGADLERADAEGRTPLLYAVQRHRLEAVRSLLALGAAAARKDRSGKSALDYARNRAQHPEILRLVSAATGERP
jgi:ankyrin repeat protein